MDPFVWGVLAGVWVAIVAYLCRCALNELNGGSVPGDDAWREFWRDDDRH